MYTSCSLLPSDTLTRHLYFQSSVTCGYSHGTQKPFFHICKGDLHLETGSIITYYKCALVVECTSWKQYQELEKCLCPLQAIFESSIQFLQYNHLQSVVEHWGQTQLYLTRVPLTFHKPHQEHFLLLCHGGVEFLSGTSSRFSRLCLICVLISTSSSSCVDWPPFTAWTLR